MGSLVVFRDTCGTLSQVEATDGGDRPDDTLRPCDADDLDTVLLGDPHCILRGVENALTAPSEVPECFRDVEALIHGDDRILGIGLLPDEIHRILDECGDLLLPDGEG